MFLLAVSFDKIAFTSDNRTKSYVVKMIKVNYNELNGFTKEQKNVKYKFGILINIILFNTWSFIETAVKNTYLAEWMAWYKLYRRTYDK